MNRWLKQSWLVLVLAGVLGTALAVVEESLKGRIQQNAEDRLERAILDVVPGGVRSEAAPPEVDHVWRVLDSNEQTIGWAVATETAGFADRIRLMVGLSPDQSSVLGVAILESRETPGLGERIREPEFLAQPEGLQTATPIEVIKPGQSAEQPIDALSGATISSRAIAKGVNESVAYVGENLGGDGERTLDDGGEQ